MEAADHGIVIEARPWLLGFQSPKKAPTVLQLSTSFETSCGVGFATSSSDICKRISPVT